MSEATESASSAFHYEALADRLRNCVLSVYPGTMATVTMPEVIAALRQAAQEIDDLKHLRQCRDQWQEQAEHLHDEVKALRGQLELVDDFLRENGCEGQPRYEALGEMKQKLRTLQDRNRVLEQALQDYVDEVAYNRWVERFTQVLGIDSPVSGEFVEDKGD